MYRRRNDGAAALLLALAAAVLGSGCEKERGSPYACSCTFLTDFDDNSGSEVTVCSPSDERAPDFARGCAQSGAPAPVEKCTCKVERGAGTCEVGLCRNRPRGE
ncbi:hypothetical protein [Polyangium spumosum]|uniref:Lipoprotein n=1 Tax=Polyangium spumosum TaxID=889282 RepID=A0A6N7Q0K1_9BACT|nr:hypothetical protein [Polyangium spumosum]MRG97982.1 hypothetical protein [Polyangium spumosum]